MADEDIINSGRDEAGRFVSKQVIQAAAQRALASAKGETDKANQAIAKLQGAYAALKQQTNAAFSAQSKGWQAAQKQAAKSFKQQTKAAARFYAQMKKQRRADSKLQAKLFTQQMREYKKLAREKIKAAKAGAPGRGSGAGIFAGGLGLGGTIISTAAIYAVVRKVWSLSAPFLSAELNRRGAAADIRNAMLNVKNVSLSAGAGLVNQYQGLGKAQFFGAGAAQIKGLTRLQSELAKGMGTERATELVKSLAESYGDATDRLNAFLAAAGTGNIEQVLQRYATGQNIVETTRALNALSIAGDADKGTLDPLVETNRKLQTTIDQLNATLEKVVNDLLPKMLPYLEKGVALLEQWTSKAGNLDLGTLALVGGGLLGARVLAGGVTRLAGRGLVGGAKLAGRGVAKLAGRAGGVTRLAGRGLVGGAKLAGRAGAAALSTPVGIGAAIGTVASLGIDEFGFDRLGGDSQRRAGRKGYGAASWYLASRSARSGVTSQAESMAEAARQRQAGATTNLDRLRAQRDEIRAKISGIGNAWGGGYSDENRDELNKLRAQYGNLTKQIQTAQQQATKAAQAGAPKQKSLWDTVKDGAKKAKDAVSKYVQKMNEIANQSRLQKLKEQAKRYDQARLNAQVAGSQTEVARAKLDLARLSPWGQQWGMMQSVPEFNRLQLSIADEIGRLEKYLATIDQSTEQGAIEGNKIKGQIIGLRREEKQNSIELLQGLTGGYLDAIGQMALGAGSKKFQRFVIARDRNLGQGLRAGMVKSNPLVGDIGGGGSVSPFQFTADMPTNISKFNQWSRKLETRFRDAHPGLMLPLPKMRQDVYGGQVMMLTNQPRAGAGRPAYAPMSSPPQGGAVATNKTTSKYADKLQQAGELLISAAKDARAEEERAPRLNRVASG